MVNFFRLKLFVEVAESESVTLVAAQRYTTQPAVSHTLKLLEEHFKVPLFRRDGRNLTLTDEGQIVYRLAKSVIEAENEAYRMIDAHKRGEVGSVSLAAGDSLGSILTELWERFHSDYPMSQCSLVINDSETVISTVAKGFADIGLCIADNVPNVVNVEKLGDTSLLLVANRKHHLATRKEVCADDLLGEYFLCSAGRYHRSYTEDRLRFAGVLSPIQIIQYGNAEQIRRSILRGNGLAFLSRNFIRDDLVNGDLGEIQIGGQVKQTSVVIVSHKTTKLTQFQKAFKEFLAGNSELIV